MNKLVTCLILVSCLMLRPSATVGQFSYTPSAPNVSGLDSLGNAARDAAARAIGDSILDAFYEVRAKYSKAAAAQIKAAVERKTDKGYQPDIKTLIFSIDTRPPSGRRRVNLKPSTKLRGQLLICPRLCWTTIDILGQLRERGYENSKEAIPVLIALLDDQDSDPTVTDKPLTPRGTRIDWRYRAKAAEALGKFGPKAKAAIPALKAVISGASIGPQSHWMEKKPDYWDGKQYSKPQLEKMLKGLMQQKATEALTKITAK